MLKGMVWLCFLAYGWVWCGCTLYCWAWDGFVRYQCRQALKLISVAGVDVSVSVGGKGCSDDDDGCGVVGCVFRSVL